MRYELPVANSPGPSATLLRDSAAGLVFTQVTSALADPTTILVAVGSDTVQDVYNKFAVDASGTSVHETGPTEWRARIGKIPVAVA